MEERPMDDDIDDRGDIDILDDDPVWDDTTIWTLTTPVPVSGTG